MQIVSTNVRRLGTASGINTALAAALAGTALVIAVTLLWTPPSAGQDRGFGAGGESARQAEAKEARDAATRSRTDDAIDRYGWHGALALAASRARQRAGRLQRQWDRDNPNAGVSYGDALNGRD